MIWVLGLIGLYAYVLVAIFIYKFFMPTGMSDVSPYSLYPSQIYYGLKIFALIMAIFWVISVPIVGTYLIIENLIEG